MRGFNLFLKRFCDIFFSGLGLIIGFPFIFVIAILVKASSKGPVFFLQERLGRKGKVFKIIKFRTMVVNAENIGTGIKVDGKGDPRITKIGKILRATSMDELPQLFNVFKGDMSLVGPRPPVVYHPYNGYDNYPEWAKPRFQMRPGMTGLVQISTRSKSSWDDRMKIDLEYIDKFNVLFDIKILFGTIKTVFDGLKA
ncbi:MAG: sugar transferase [Clostridiales bacterium]|nr:sugar transferase [Clostridiales bacterium]